MRATQFQLGALLTLMIGCAVAADPSSAVDKQGRKDRYGDALPEGALARLGTLRLRHKGGTKAAVFTPDGKTVIVSDDANEIVYWDVATGKEARRYNAPGAVSSLAISADGKTLASGGDRLSLWEVGTGKMISHDGNVSEWAMMQILFTPDGKTMALCFTSPTIYLWDAVQNKKLRELKGHTGDVQSMDLSPDGKTLASGGWDDRHVRLWDVATGSEIRHFVAADKLIVRVAFSPDGKTLASLGDDGFRLWEAASGKKIWEMGADLLEDFAFSPDGKTIVGWKADRRFHVYDAPTGKELRKSDVGSHRNGFLALSADGKTAATWSSDGDQSFDLWDVASGKLLHPFEGHRREVRSLAFSADGATLFSSGGYGGDLHEWKVSTGEPCKPAGVNSSEITGLSLSPDGKLLAAWGYPDDRIRLLDVVTRKEVRVFKEQVKGQTAVGWSGDGKTLVSRNDQDKTIHLWDVITGKQRRVLSVKQVYRQEVALSPDGKILTAGGFRDGSIHRWDAVSGAELPSVQTGHGRVPVLAFSPDGTILASGDRNGGICLWKHAGDQLLNRWDATPGGVKTLAFTHDGRSLIAGCDDGAVQLREVPTGQERVSFKGGGGSVLSLAVSRDGRVIASGNEDTTILLWDATNGIRPDAALSADQLQKLWADLIGNDAGQAYRAIWRMALSPKQALPYLKARLHPAAPPDAAALAKLLADLDADGFDAREKATAGLIAKGAQAEGQVRAFLKTAPSGEARRRAEEVLHQIAGSETQRRELRAVEALERAGTDDAKQLLRELAKGASGVRLTDEAAAAFDRLDQSK